MASSPRPRFFAGRSSAFTLIEMLIVIGLILILLGVAIPNFLNALERARNTQCKTLLLLLKSTVATYHTDTRQWPESGSEHLYYIFSGLTPFSAKNSKRYNPPYMQFDAASVGRDNYPDVYKDHHITLKNRDGSTSKDLLERDLRSDPPVYDPDLVKWKPVVDPWQRPIVYISPTTLNEFFNAGNNRNLRPWGGLIALDSEEGNVISPDGVLIDPPPYVPFGLNSGQFWSAGRDGATAVADDKRADELGLPLGVGYLQPGNLSGSDRRDNDSDGLQDETDFKARNDNPLPEDDLNSW